MTGLPTLGSTLPGSTLNRIAAELMAADDATYASLPRTEPISYVLAAAASLLPKLKAVLFPKEYGLGGEGRALATTLGEIYGELLQLVQLTLPLSGRPFGASDASAISERFVSGLPHVRALLLTDVEAAMVGDPAGPSETEVILAYPSIKALTAQRLAHCLFGEGVPVLPRVMTERAHAETGIDIHPGARIGKHCFIDHGTGVVIGETAVVGERVRLYQGVTLGAKSFPRDEAGRILKGLARHPVIGDDVVIYSGATILGRTLIGNGSIIGGNVWLTHDVPARSRVLQSPAHEEAFRGHGDGI